MNQVIILEYMQKYPHKWFNNKELATAVNLRTVSQLTGKLFRDGFILKKSKPFSNRREFKYINEKRWER